MVAHGILHILYGDFAVGFQVERHGLIGFTFYIRKEFLTTIGKHIEVTPYAGFAVTTCTEIQRSVCISKAEIFVHTVEVTFFAGKGDDIGRIHTVVLIIHIELVDARLVGMCRDAIIGDAHSHPHGTTHTGAFANHFHNPDLVRISDSERLATAVIAIFLYKVGHHLDSFTGGTGTLQTEINQTSVVDDTGGIYQFRTTSESGFSNGKLKFVDIADDVVRLACLLNLSQILAGVPLMHIHQGTFLMYARRIMI